MRRVRSKLPKIRAGLAVVASVAMLIGTSPSPVRAKPSEAKPPGTPAAAQGPGSPDRPLPVSAVPNHGLPAGQRAPVEPPAVKAAGAAGKVSARRWASLKKPARGAKQGLVEAGGRGADALVLRSGYAAGDTSLVVYFSLADTAIESWSATVYDAASQESQQSVTLGKGDLPVCGSVRQFCRGFGGAEGWALDAGHDYFVQITVSYPDGSTVTSASSNTARPRKLGESPSIPAAQAVGCACPNALARTTAGQQLRGAGVNTGTGAFTLVGTDLQMASFAVPFTLRRVYSSANTSSGLFGNGWASTFDMRVTATDTGATVRADDGAQADYRRGDDGSYTRPAGVRSNLKKTDSGWELTTPEQVHYAFDGSGRLVSVKNDRGYGVTLAYDGTGLKSVTDAAGRTGTVEIRTDLGLIRKVTLPDGRFTQYDYEGGRLQSYQSATRHTTQYRYTDGRLTQVVNARGLNDVTNTYDPATGRVTSQTDVYGKVTKVEWDAGKNEAKVTDPDGVVDRDGYSGNLLKYRQNGNGDTVNDRYDSAANPVLEVDGNANQHEKGFDGAGNTTSQKAPDPFSFTESAGYESGNRPTSYTDGNGHEWKAEYNDHHEVTKRTDAEGHSYEYTYDNRGLRSTQKDPRGKVTHYEYDSAGNLTAVVQPSGRRTEYGYDGTGRRTSMTDPRGTVAGANRAAYTTSYTYDEQDRPLTTKQPGKNQPWVRGYDELGQLKTETNPIAGSTIYTYDDAGRLKTKTSPEGRVVNYEYTAAGRVSAQIDGQQDKTTYAYSNKGLLEKKTSPRGNVSGADPAPYTTTYHYDSNDNLVRSEQPNPGGGTVKHDTGYDSLDRADTDTDELGKQSTSQFDNADNLKSATDPLGSSVKFDYDKANHRTAMADPKGKSAHIEYDDDGNPTKQTSVTGGVTTWTYDDDGRLASEVDPRGNAGNAEPDDYRTRYDYDQAGNLTTVTDPLGDKTAYAYDAVNRLTSTTDADNHVTSYRYDDADRTAAVIGPDAPNGQATTYDYDADGLVSAVHDPNRHTRSMLYDLAGRMTASTDDLGRYREYAYDADGNTTETVIARTVADPRNPGRDPLRPQHTITDTYDPIGRMTRSQLGTAGPVYTYGYNAKNQLTSTGAPGQSESRSYDDAGRLHEVTRGDDTFGYGYDLNGNATSRTYPDGTRIGADYDGDDRMTSLTVGGQSWSFGYDPAGRRTSTTLPDGTGLTEDRAYDRAGRLTKVDTHGDAGSTGRYELTYDKVGNPTVVTTTRGGTHEDVAYTYDQADRVTAACYGTTRCDTGGTGKIGYTYDLVGNRLTQNHSGSAGNSSTTYSYDAVDQLTAETSTGSGAVSRTYKYDSEGNQTDAGNDRYSYNLDHSLLSATVGGQSTSYTYDASGNRVSATTGSQTRTWKWDVADDLPQIAVETGPQGNRSYGYGPDDEPVSLTTAGDGTSDYVHDWLGGTSAVVSASGAVQAVYDYDPYGVARTSPTQSGLPVTANPAATANPLRFTGAYADPSLNGDYYLRARNYDPDSGRFTTVDPQPAGTGSPAVSRYAYAGDNPLVNRDPTGQLSLGGIVDDIKGAAKKTGDWVKKHQADVAGVVAGAAVGIGCEVATGGTGSIGCAAAAGAAGNATSYAWKTKVQHKGKFSWGELGKQTAVGAATGAVLGAAGKVAGKALSAGASKLAGRFGSKVAGSGARAGARSASEDEASGLANAASCHSFDPATPVLLANGTTKPIRDVKLGDRVTATDPATGATTARTVTALHDNRDRDLTDITVKTAAGAVGVVHTTAHHRFFDATTGDWVTADKLSIGDQLRSEDGKVVRVAAVRTVVARPHRMLDLTVDTVHAYYVLAAGTPVLVHNCNTSGVYRSAGSTPSELEGSAIQARDTFARRMSGLSQSQRPTTVTAGYNVETGEYAAGASSSAGCAEVCVANTLGGDASKIRFTPAVLTRRSRLLEQQPVCLFCEARFGRKAFPSPETEFESDPLKMND